MGSVRPSWSPSKCTAHSGCSRPQASLLHAPRAPSTLFIHRKCLAARNSSHPRLSEASRAHLRGLQVQDHLWKPLSLRLHLQKLLGTVLNPLRGTVRSTARRHSSHHRTSGSFGPSKADPDASEADLKGSVAAPGGLFLLQPLSLVLKTHQGPQSQVSASHDHI